MSSNTTHTTLPLPNDTTFSIPQGCLVLHFEDFIPWNNEDNLVSFETEDLIRRLKDVLFLPILFLIGCPANVINMAVFYRQGLKERINVCLFALSLADELYLICNMLWYGEQLVLTFTTREIYGPMMQWMTNRYLLGFYGFTWVSQVVSAIIATERCFCILRPLRSHTLLSTSTTVIVIVVVFVVVVGVYFIVVSRYYVTCAFDAATNSVIMTLVGGEFYYRHKTLVDFLDVIVYGAALPGLMTLIVMSTTVVTVVKLRQAMAWRAMTSSRGGGGEEGGGGGGGGGGGLSAKEIGVTRMLVYNSVFFIICVFPIGLFRFVLLFMPEMNAGRRYHNFFMTGLWLLNIFSYINATFNFLIYYTMGSRYRQTLRNLLGTCGRAKSTSSGSSDSKGPGLAQHRP